ncbi:hypothetical protein DFJ74DRAFT_708058 [Hyaloraphidium curvatum]|nr:hypothetical protein DFJ74DRAFT_708058 [Hyaloraphidium curvatum]
MAADKPAILVALEGSWILDHKNSDKFEDVLSAQGVGWVVRKLIVNSTPRVGITAKSSEKDGKTVWVMHNTTSGVGPTTQTRDILLDGKEVSLEDPLFGVVLSTPSISEDGKTLFIKSRSEKGGWEATAIWSVSDDGKVQIRTNTFKSKSLNKDFVMRYNREH